MGEERKVYKVLMGKPEGKRPLGRPRRRWEDGIRMDLREIGLGCVDWIRLAQDVMFKINVQLEGHTFPSAYFISETTKRISVKSGIVDLHQCCNFGAYQLVTTNPYVTQDTNWTNTSKTLLVLSYNIFTVIQRSGGGQ
jgi:hypothetical protein